MTVELEDIEQKNIMIKVLAQTSVAHHAFVAAVYNTARRRFMRWIIQKTDNLCLIYTWIIRRRLLMILIK